MTMAFKLGAGSAARAGATVIVQMSATRPSVQSDAGDDDGETTIVTEGMHLRLVAQTAPRRVTRRIIPELKPSSTCFEERDWKRDMPSLQAQRYDRSKRVVERNVRSYQVGAKLGNTCVDTFRANYDTAASNSSEIREIICST
jgi:hypothetical protein